MEISKSKNGSTLILSPAGRLDTTSAPELDSALQESLDGVTELILDLSALEYMSSAGLRILLSTQKRMNTQGKMVVKNVNATIMEVFEITGFADILTIEN